MVPNPQVRRDIATKSVEFCIRWGLRQVECKQLPNSEVESFDVAQPARALMSQLLSCLLENRATIADSLKESIVVHINGQNDITSFIACEIGLHLRLATNFSSAGDQQSQDTEFWHSLSESISETCYERILSLCPKYYQLCARIIHSSRSRISISDFVRWHGIDSLFKKIEYIVFSSVMTISIADSTLYSFFYIGDDRENQKQLIIRLDELGQIFIASPVPIIRKVDFLPGADFFDIYSRTA